MEFIEINPECCICGAEVDYREVKWFILQLMCRGHKTFREYTRL